MAGTLNRDCECWEHTVSVKFIDTRFPREALSHIYCPRCSPGIRKNDACMVEEEGWLIEYNPNLLKQPSAPVRVIQQPRGMGAFKVFVGNTRSL